MTQPEYLTVLVSIIVGLGVTDLAQSIRDLLHPDRPVRWHWLPLTWAAVAILMVVVTWWAFFQVLQAEVWSSPQAFLLILAATLNLYFLCAFALPDLDGPPVADRPDRVDLESFYFSASHRRSFFGFAIAFYLFFELIIRVWRVTELELSYAHASENTATNVAIFCVPYGLMIFTDRKWIHVLLTIGSMAGIGLLLFGVRTMMSGG